MNENENKLSKYFSPVKFCLMKNKIRSNDIELIKELYAYDLNRIKHAHETRDVKIITNNRDYFIACIKTHSFERKLKDNSKLKTLEFTQKYQNGDYDDYIKKFKEDFKLQYPDATNIDFNYSRNDYNWIFKTYGYTIFTLKFKTWRKEFDEYYILSKYQDLIREKTAINFSQFDPKNKIIGSFLNGQMPLEEFKDFVQTYETRNRFDKYM